MCAWFRRDRKMSETWEIWSKQYVFFAPPERSMGPIAIVFQETPLRKSKKDNFVPGYGDDSPLVAGMKAWSIDRRGNKRPATSSEISSLVGYKAGRCFYTTGDGNGISIDRLRFCIWLLGGKWSCAFIDQMQWQVDYLTPQLPPT